MNAREESVFFSKVFHELPVGVVVFPAKRGSRLIANREAARLFGKHLAALTKTGNIKRGEKKPTTYPTAELPWKEALAKRAASLREDLVLVRPREEGVFLRALAMPVLDRGAVAYVITIFEDMTSHKHVEDELYERTVKLEIANEHLKNLDRAKTEFVSLASHQLKTPLTAIRWFLELVLGGDAGEVKPEQREYLQDAYRAVEQLVELMNFLLNISRIETGRLTVNPKPADLTEFAKEIMREAEPLFLARNQEYRFAVRGAIPVVPIDEKLIRQVLLNLLSNASKYTPEHGTITLAVTRKGREVVFEVRDTGYGIPEKEQLHMFEKFFRASNTTKESEGTGLGLYLARALVEISGGTMWFSSKEGRGSSFFFSLPLTGSAPRRGDRTIADYPNLIRAFRKFPELHG